MTRKKFLYIGVCIALAVLLVGVALYFISWPTDVALNNISTARSNGNALLGYMNATLTLRRHNYIFRPAEYEVLEFDAPEREDSFTVYLPEGCRAVSQHDDPSYVITQGYFKAAASDEAHEVYFAFSIDNGLFIARFPNGSPLYLVGYTDQYHRPIQVTDYFSDFIDNECQP